MFCALKYKRIALVCVQMSFICKFGNCDMYVWKKYFISHVIQFVKGFNVCLLKNRLKKTVKRIAVNLCQFRNYFWNSNYRIGTGSVGHCKIRCFLHLTNTKGKGCGPAICSQNPSPYSGCVRVSYKLSCRWRRFATVSWWSCIIKEGERIIIQG